MRSFWAITALGLIVACSSEDKGPTQRDQIGQVWKYESGADGKVKVAYIGSANSVETMTAPDTFSVLMVQPLKTGGADVTVKLVGAPFSCDLSDCRISAMTDDGKRHEWKGRMTENRDGIEIPPSQQAYEAIKDTQTLKVDLVVGTKDQRYPFQFNVAGLELKS